MLLLGCKHALCRAKCYKTREKTIFRPPSQSLKLRCTEGLCVELCVGTPVLRPHQMPKSETPKHINVPREPSRILRMLCLLLLFASSQENLPEHMLPCLRMLWQALPRAAIRAALPRAIMRATAREPFGGQFRNTRQHSTTRGEAPSEKGRGAGPKFENNLGLGGRRGSGGGGRGFQFTSPERRS